VPSGLTASWSSYTFTAAGSTQLTISSTAQTGPNGYTVQVNGPFSNGLNHAVSLPFTIVAPNDFTLEPAPAILNLGPGSTASYAILVEGGGGFTGSVNLSVSGVPAGLTATISPSAASQGGQGTLTVTTFTCRPEDHCIPAAAAPPKPPTSPTGPPNAAIAQFIFVGSSDTRTPGKYLTTQPNEQVRYTDHGRDEVGTWKCPGQ